MTDLQSTLLLSSGVEKINAFQDTGLSNLSLKTSSDEDFMFSLDAVKRAL